METNFHIFYEYITIENHKKCLDITPHENKKLISR